MTSLEKSIKKWEGIVEGTRVDAGADNCALCKEYKHLSCAWCPVREKTGKWNCIGTPYDEWSRYCDTYDEHGEFYRVFDEESKRLAQDMLDFLRSL